MARLSGHFSALVPQFTHYCLLISTPDIVVDHTEDRYKRCYPYSVLKVSYDMLPLVEKSRPGYSTIAEKYLDDGHIGFCVNDRDFIASMAWVYYNDKPSKVRVTYFPLLPNRAWLHADWTNPIYRGKGLHKLLIYHRARYVMELFPQQASPILLKSNINPCNLASLNNYKKCGFKENGDIYIFKFWKGCFSWKRSLQ